MSENQHLAPPPKRMMQSVFPKKQGVDTVALGDMDDGDSAPTDGSDAVNPGCEVDSYGLTEDEELALFVGGEEDFDA